MQAFDGLLRSFLHDRHTFVHSPSFSDQITDFRSTERILRTLHLRPHLRIAEQDSRSPHCSLQRNVPVQRTRQCLRRGRQSFSSCVRGCSCSRWSDCGSVRSPEKQSWDDWSGKIFRCFGRNFGCCCHLVVCSSPCASFLCIFKHF